LPGLFTAINPESALPVNRVFASYGYYDGFNVRTPTGIQRGFNLNRWDVGAELAFLENRASVYVRVPYLDATQNTSGAAIDGLGDISAGFKVALLADPDSGSVLSAGITVSAPTSRDLVAITNLNVGIGADRVAVPGPGVIIPNAPNAGLPMLTVPPPTIARVNPTFIQPYIAALLGMDRIYVQDYLAVVVPTDNRVSTYINNDLAVGYQLYRNQGGLLSSFTPTADVQLLLPVNHQGSSPAGTGSTLLNVPGEVVDIHGMTIRGAPNFPPVNAPPLSLRSSYQVFVTGGAQVGLMDRVLLSLGVSVPVAGPRAYNVGGTVGLNYFY
jgi:hypothetical protein